MLGWSGICGSATARASRASRARCRHTLLVRGLPTHSDQEPASHRPGPRASHPRRLPAVPRAARCRPRARVHRGPLRVILGAGFVAASPVWFERWGRAASALCSWLVMWGWAATACWAWCEVPPSGSSLLGAAGCARLMLVRGHACLDGSGLGFVMGALAVVGGCAGRGAGLPRVRRMLPACCSSCAFPVGGPTRAGLGADRHVDAPAPEPRPSPSPMSASRSPAWAARWCRHTLLGPHTPPRPCLHLGHTLTSPRTTACLAYAYLPLTSWLAGPTLPPHNPLLFLRL
jgi:hypothetical protein